MEEEEKGNERVNVMLYLKRTSLFILCSVAIPD